MANIVDSIFGTGKTPGYAGTGQETFNPYKIDTNAQNTQNGQQLQQQAQNQFNLIATRQAPTADAANVGRASLMSSARAGDDYTTRDQQYTLNQQLADQAAGRGPSLATAQLNDAQDRNAKQAMGLAASMPGGGNPALAARNAQMQASQGNQQAAHDAAQARIQEQMNARSQLGQNLQATRAQTQGINTTNANFRQEANQANAGAQNQFALTQAQMQQQANLANQNAALQNQAQMDQAQQFYYGNQVGMDQANRSAAMQMQQMQAQQNLGVMGLEQNAYNSAAQRQGNFTSGVVDTLGKVVLGGISDENQKTNVSKLSSKDLDEIYGKSSATYGTGSASTADDNMAGMKDAFSKASSSPGMSGLGAMGVGSVGGFGANALRNSVQGTPLGGILFPAPSSDTVASTGMQNPGGDMRIGKDSSLDVMGSLKAINDSTVINPTMHPGAQPSSSASMSIGPLRLSDEKQKEDIEDMARKADNDVKKLGAYSYKYKDPSMPGAAPGTHYGPMAQELEKTTIFAPAVFQAPNGTKMVDWGRTVAPMLAAQGDQSRRLQKLEEIVKRKG